MSKICTNIKESKRLIKLGINPSTADMCYIREQWFDDEKGKMKEAWSDIPVVDTPKDKDYPSCLEPITLPAWSLSALLDLMPNNIDTLELHLYTPYKGNWRCEYSSEEDVLISKNSNNQLDAVFEMICWLKENKKN